MEKYDEKLIVEQIQKWNWTAFEKIYLQYKDQIYSYARNILNNNDNDAIEVVSESFLKLFEYLKKKSVDNVKSLLYRIVHNEAVNLIKKNEKSVMLDEEIYEKPNLDDDIIEEMQKKYKSDLIQQCLQKLQSKYKEVIYLYYFEQKDYQEIAFVLWTNKNTIWTLISRAKKQLKQLCKDLK